MLDKKGLSFFLSLFFEMMCLRNVSSIRSDLQIRGKCGWELNVMERIEQNVLKYFGHAGTMGEERPD